MSKSLQLQKNVFLINKMKNKKYNAVGTIPGFINIAYMHVLNPVINKTRFWANTISLTPPLIIEVSVPCPESKRSCICVLVILILPPFTIFLFYFGIGSKPHLINYRIQNMHISYIDKTIVILQKTMKKTIFMYADIIFINER
jgi:hypothetical protein